MVHPHTKLQYINSFHEYGVFAAQKIPRGTIVWALGQNDRLYTLQEVRAMPDSFHPILRKYAYLAPEGFFVLCWDQGRHINHSCNPNLRSLAHHEIAIRDISEGEEITCEYGSLNFFGSLDCYCGAKNCRKTIRATDVLTYYQDWDAIIQQTLPYFPRVEQPLPLSINEQTPIPSIRSSFHPQFKEFWQFLSH